VAEWLSFWSADTRARNEDLHGGPLEGVYVPYGKGRIALGDLIYCVGIEDEELRLIARVRVASLKDDPDDEESVLIDNADEDVDVDFDREVPPEVVEAIEYEHVDGSKHPMPVVAVRIDPSPFQGRSSIRALAQGVSALDSLL
jgi:hypothetical protein